jgi:hypothetical protein
VLEERPAPGARVLEGRPAPGARVLEGRPTPVLEGARVAAGARHEGAGGETGARREDAGEAAAGGLGGDMSMRTGREVGNDQIGWEVGLTRKISGAQVPICRDTTPYKRAIGRNQRIGWPQTECPYGQGHPSTF